MQKASGEEEPSTNQGVIRFDEPVARLPQAGFAFEDDSAEITNEAHPGLINRHQLALLIQLCKRLEDFGVSPKAWRDQIEHLSGFRSRRALTAAAAVRVISSFAHTLNRLVADETK